MITLSELPWPPVGDKCEKEVTLEDSLQFHKMPSVPYVFSQALYYAEPDLETIVIPKGEKIKLRTFLNVGRLTREDKTEFEW